MKYIKGRCDEDFDRELGFGKHNRKKSLTDQSRRRAQDRKREYLIGKCTISSIKDMATATGDPNYDNIEVWLDVFKDIPEVIKELNN